MNFIRKIQYLFILCLSFQVASASDETLNTVYYREVVLASPPEAHLEPLKDLAKGATSIALLSVEHLSPLWAVLKGLTENPTLSSHLLVVSNRKLPREDVHLAEKIAGKHAINLGFFEGSSADIEMSDVDLIYLASTENLDEDLKHVAPSCKLALAIQGISNRESWDKLSQFLSDHPEWSLYKRFFAHSGMTILKRNNFSQMNEKRLEAIDRAIKSRIILCTGPAFQHRERLAAGIEKDLVIAPYKKVFLATSDPACLDLSIQNLNIHTELFEARGRSLDCTNAILATLKAVINDPDCLDEDIILFKHENDYIEDAYLFGKAVGKCLDGYDLVSRYQTSGNWHPTDGFLMRVSSARKFLKEIGPISEFPSHLPHFCEGYFSHAIVGQIENIYKVEFNHLIRGSTELGLFHLIPPGEEFFDGYWNRDNYAELYK